MYSAKASMANVNFSDKEQRGAFQRGHLLLYSMAQAFSEKAPQTTATAWPVLAICRGGRAIHLPAVKSKASTEARGWSWTSLPPTT